MSQYLRLKYIFIFYAIIRIPLHTLVINIDGKGRIYTILLLLFIIYMIISRKNKKKLSKGQFLIWRIWVIYAFINTLIHGMNFNMTYWQFFTYLAAPLVVIYLINIEEKIDYKRLFTIITTAAYINILIISIFENTRYFIGQGYRLGETLNANEIGINALLCFYLLYQNFMWKKLKFRTFIILIIIPLYVIFSTGSRSAFLPLILIFISHFIIIRRKNLFGTLAIILIGILFLNLATKYIEKKSIVINRLRITKEEGRKIAHTGTLVDNLGGRAVYFLYGYEIFKSHPIWGIGLGNYRFFNPISSQPNHVEIMIQLSELGIIGFSLFFMFNFWIAHKLCYCWKYLKHQRRQIETYILGFLVVVSLSFTTYTYSHILIFTLYGITIAYIFEAEKLIRKGYQLIQTSKIGK